MKRFSVQDALIHCHHRFIFRKLSHLDFALLRAQQVFHLILMIITEETLASWTHPYVTNDYVFADGAQTSAIVLVLLVFVRADQVLTSAFGRLNSFYGFLLAGGVYLLLHAFLRLVSGIFAFFVAHGVNQAGFSTFEFGIL